MANRTTMGLDFGLDQFGTKFKTKFRWIFNLPDVSASGIAALPPLGFSRPSISFKTEEIQHITETIKYPVKPEFKDIDLTLIDIKRPNTPHRMHPVFQWVKSIYDPRLGIMEYPVDADFYKQGTLSIYDGAGCELETWVFENCWPQSIEFGQLNMADSEVLTVDISLSFHRAYLLDTDNSQNIDIQSPQSIEPSSPSDIII